MLSASDELLRETGQPHHVVRSHNELNVAKVATCVSMFLKKTFYRQRCAKRKLPVFTQRPILRFFAPQGRCVAPMGVKFGTEEGTECPVLRTKFHPHRRNDKGVGPQNKFLLRLDQNVEYKRPAGAYPFRDFHKICRICTPFQDALGVKIWLDMLEGLWRMELWGF